MLVEGRHAEARIDERSVQQGRRVEQAGEKDVGRAFRRRRGDQRSHLTESVLGQADEDVEVQRACKALGHKASDAPACGALDDLARQPAVRTCVVTVGGVRLPQRLLGGKRVDHWIPGIHVLQRYRSVDCGQAGAVAEQPADEDLLFAGLRELRPVARHGRVEVELALLREQMGGDGDHALGGGGDHLQGFGGIGLAAGGPGAAPQVDHRFAVEVDAASGADIAVLLEVRRERVADSLESLCDSAVQSDLDRHDRSVLPPLRRSARQEVGALFLGSHSAAMINTPQISRSPQAATPK